MGSVDFHDFNGVTEILKGVFNRVLLGKFNCELQVVRNKGQFIYEYFIDCDSTEECFKRFINIKGLEHHEISNLFESQMNGIYDYLDNLNKKNPVKPDNTLKIISADEVRKRMESNSSNLLNDLLNEFNKTVEYYLDNMQGKNKPFKIYLTAKQRNHIPFRKVLEGLGYVLTDINDKDDLDTIVSLGFEDGSDKFDNMEMVSCL